MIIGISGKAGSGKDTIANIINNINSNAVTICFADSMKNALYDCLCYFGIEGNDFYTNEGKNKQIPLLDNITIRELMQKFGTIIREEIHPDFWVKIFISKIKTLLLHKLTVVTPDVRFPNEKKAIEDIGGIVIRVERPSIKTMDHISETALDNSKFYYTILNDGTLEDLEIKVREFLSTLEGLKLKN